MNVIRLVTAGPVEALEPCIDPYLCSCERHVQEREDDVARGVREDLPQPWQPSAPRFAAARLREAA